ncbi:MAG TPA: DinB family protein [Mucilaginibacter sp.]|jgi:hypothetical protein
MISDNKPEVWLRGALNDIPDLLQPVAHALLQAREEIGLLMQGFPDGLLWERPGGIASPGFHLQHLTGVLNRLLAYANGKQLNRQQLEYLASEGKSAESITVSHLLKHFNEQIDNAIVQLKQTDISVLTEAREVGRAKLPSTVIGLYVHAAEHTMRHVGQLLVTVKILNAKYL